MANHEQGRLPDSDNRETPPALYAEKHARWRFNLDAAADQQNAKCETIWTQGGQFVRTGAGLWVKNNTGDGLSGHWYTPLAERARVWCNPPYSDIEPWIIKAWEEVAGEDCQMAYLLVPNWTDRKWWQALVEPFRDGKALPDATGGVTLQTEFMTRQRFLYLGEPIRTKDGKVGQPEFGLVGLIFERSEQ